MADYTVSPASLLSAQVSMFSSVTRTKPADCLPLELVLTRIKHGAHQHQITHLRDVLTSQGKAAYDAARKENLPAFTPAGVFPRRGNANLTEASGLVHFDFDHPPDLAAAKALLSADPYIAYGLSDSNRTILAAKKLRHIAQTLVRHLINHRFDVTLYEARHSRLKDGPHASYGCSNKHRPIKSLGAKSDETRHPPSVSQIA